MSTRQRTRHYLRRHYHVSFAHVEKLREISESTGINESEHVRRALDHYLFSDLYLFKKRRVADQVVVKKAKKKPKGGSL